MASKSKKRRRVLGASCILAALIIAGSSFAWFTSKDEVTNRLTASSDYGVSIVESFTPPANWLPGQEINKDVYAVNTGSIAAFVKETVSGVLNYTYESLVDDWTVNCVELGENVVTAIDGVTNEEAGGFLAWNNAGAENGPVYSMRVEDDTDPAEGWRPTETGDYIFRRSIVTSDENDDTVTFENPKYTYAGYHYDKDADKFYKIVIGNDSYPTVSLTGDGKYVYDLSATQAAVTSGGATVGEDGIITGDVPIKYVVLSEVNNEDVTLTYGDTLDVAGDDALDKYLTAYYSDDKGTNAQIGEKAADLEQAKADLAAAKAALNAASTDQAQKEVIYQDALGAYNTALSRYNQTKADYDYAAALTAATNDLIDAADERAAVEAGKDAAEDRLEAAATALNYEANMLIVRNLWLYAMLEDSEAVADARNHSEIGTYTLIPATDRARITAYNNTYGGLGNVVSNLALFDAKYAEMIGYAAEICNALDELANISDAALPDNYAAYTDSERVAQLIETIETNKAALEAATDEYEALYAEIHRSVVAEDNLTGLDIGASDDITGFITQYIDTFNTDDLNDAADEYEEAYDAYTEYVKPNGLIAQADEAWAEAVAAYNTAVTTAKGEYDAAIAEVQPKPNYYAPDYLNDSDVVTDTGYLIDNGATLVPYNGGTNTAGYSANFDDGDNPATTAIETNSPLIGVGAALANWKTYTTDDTYSTKPWNSDVIVKQTVADDDNFEQLAASISPASKNGNLGALADALAAAEAAMNDANDEYTAAQDEFAAQTANVAAANTAAAAAQSAIDALTDDSSVIKMYIVLDDNWEDNWTMNNDGSEAVDFYYNHILEAGETSEKLIDCVVLDKDVTSLDYKNLTFDLNVALDSAQVTYENDQKTYAADAVNDNEAFDFDATVTDNTDVTWA